MNKIILSVLAAATLLVPSASFAASISNPLFSNGQTAIDATGGSTVSGTFTLTVGNNEVIEWLRTQSDPSQPFVDTSVGGTLGYQEQVYTGIPFSVKVPPNTGTYYPTVQGAGIFMGNRAINGADNVVLGSTGLGTVRVVANGSTGGLYNGMDINALIEALKAAGFTVTAPGSTGGATTPAKDCPPTYPGHSVISVQGWLVDHGYLTEAQVSTGPGIFGPKTSSAYTLAVAQCK